MAFLLIELTEQVSFRNLAKRSSIRIIYTFYSKMMIILP
ncbi:hypothetical protein KP78_09970 [Jeotgalibacillus soli]|uniref:Uncharacterized protein n=1 Tax=Jeotgalibacillus soli TaxID=889306 RepID=A0A0C2S692_9BACL|nr:hypothetical protein KP78_09970 [Jeotgalibacillus soli]